MYKETPEQSSVGEHLRCEVFEDGGGIPLCRNKMRFFFSREVKVRLKARSGD